MKKSSVLWAAVPTAKTDDVLKATSEKPLNAHVPEGCQRQIAVSGVGVVTLSPDQCLMTVTVSSTKDEIQEAINSVKRRLDYIVQALKNHHVKDSEMEVYKSLDRKDGKFCATSEVVVSFHDSTGCEGVHNLLVEKLDDSVKISEPVFFCSSQARENARCRAASLAVHNAKTKAADMARQLGEVVGETVLVREDSAEEKEGAASTAALAAAEAAGGHRSSIYRRQVLAMVTVKSAVTVVFVLKS